MNSIRPLATITILAVVGVILYVKINEGPAHYAPPAGQSWPTQPPGVPPLDASPSGESAIFRTSPSTGGTSAPPAGGTAPPWTGAGTAVSPPPIATPISSAATTPPTQRDAVSVPPMPDIPELPPLPSETKTSAAAPPPATDLPANIPVAQYAGATPSPNAPTVPSTVSGRVPSLGTATPDIAASTPSAVTPFTAAPPALTDVEPTVPPPTAPVTATEPPAAVSPPVESGSVPIAAPAATDDGRYGSVAPASADGRSAADTSFAEAWLVIESALQRQELARAHLLLSQWYGDPSLSPDEAQRVESLLSQLAGTVVYSTEHQLEPAYMVRPGDTLETIAKQYDVPWQLLAKINGIPAVDGVRPGQQLKVLRGPFSAVVELQKGQLTLTLDGRYAGKFPIRVEPTSAVSEGQWLVDQKLILPTDNSQFGAAPASVDRALVLRSGEGTGSNTPLLIASSSTSMASQPASPAIGISPRDAEELSDILSVGSRVVIRQ